MNTDDAVNEFALGSNPLAALSGTGPKTPLPVVADPDDPDAPPPVSDEQFPTDLATCFKLVQRLDNDLDDEGNPINRSTGYGTPAEQRARAVRLKKLKVHLHLIQQGAIAAPPDTANEQAENRLHRQNYRVHSNNRLAELAASNPAVAALLKSANP